MQLTNDLISRHAWVWTGSFNKRIKILLREKKIILELTVVYRLYCRTDFLDEKNNFAYCRSRSIKFERNLCLLESTCLAHANTANNYRALGRSRLNLMWRRRISSLNRTKLYFQHRKLEAKRKVSKLYIFCRITMTPDLPQGNSEKLRQSSLQEGLERGQFI